MCIANSLLVELEELSKIVAREMPLGVLCRIDNTSRQILLGTPEIAEMAELFFKRKSKTTHCLWKIFSSIVPVAWKR
jgi:hypothetical protein